MATSGMTDYLKDKVINHVLRGTSYTSPANRYLGVFPSSSTLTSAGGGTEASGGSYARQNVGSAFGAPSPSGTTNNSSTVTFTMPAGTWRWLVVFDASTAGNRLLWSKMDADVTTSSGGTLSFAANKLTWVVV